MAWLLCALLQRCVVGCVVAIGCIATLRWCTVGLTRNGRTIVCCTLYSLDCTARLIFCRVCSVCCIGTQGGACGLLRVACCMLYVVCCMLHAAFCLLHVASCLLRAAMLQCCNAACCRNAPAGRERVQCGHRLHERAHELKRFVRAPSETGAAAGAVRSSEAKACVPEGEPHCFVYGRCGQFHRRVQQWCRQPCLGKHFP
jgi:hypothetical protein